MVLRRENTENAVKSSHCGIFLQSGFCNNQPSRVENLVCVRLFDGLGHAFQYDFAVVGRE
jgi:hypothetical protein